jgi:hypothetical protein
MPVSSIQHALLEEPIKWSVRGLKWINEYMEYLMIPQTHIPDEPIVF